MKKLALAVLLVACSKHEPPKPAPPVVQGDTAAAGDPAKLPPAGQAPAPATVDKELAMWNASINTLQGKPMHLADYKGKALMIVNVASKCGLTPQYETLEAVQKKYESKGFTVIGFPCNQFGHQEPGSAQEIQTFCSTTYGITFPMTEKIEVNGPGRHDIYKALTPIADAEGHTGDIRWNFEKFLVGRDGNVIARFGPLVVPEAPELVESIEKAL